MTADKVFNSIAKDKMKEWDFKKFKAEYPTLYKVIIEAMKTYEEMQYEIKAHKANWEIITKPKLRKK